MQHVLAAVALTWLALPADAPARTGMTEVVRATYRLRNEGSTATCFVVACPGEDPNGPARRVLVTCHHVLAKAKGETTDLMLRKPGRKPGTYESVTHRLAIRREGKPLWRRHPDRDVAVLDLPAIEGAPVCALPLAAIASAEDWRDEPIGPGGLVRCVGYPHAAVFGSDEPGFPVTRLGCVASHPLRPLDRRATFLADYNTFEGDSGSPVLWQRTGRRRGGQVLILGLVTGQHFFDQRYNLVYQRGHLRYRLGLAIVVHSGIIREAIAGPAVPADDGEGDAAEE